jgi:hypothetical protein
MIPQEYVSPRAVSTLIEYLRQELYQAEGERRPLEEKWLKYHRAYRCVPEFEVKEFPFVGAANLVLPVVATDVDTIFSRLMGILFAPQNLWSIRPLQDEMVDIAPRLEEFLQWAQNAELKVYDSTADFLLEMCKLGTGILKQRYRREQKTVYTFRETPQGIMEQIKMMMVKDNPVVEHVSLWDFYVPSTATNIQDAPWASERIRLTWGQLESRFRAGLYQGGERLASWSGKDKGHWLDNQMQQMDSYNPAHGDRFDLDEVWLDYDISASGEPMSLVCTLHRPSMSILRVDFNPFFNQEKPFSAARYLRVEKRFYGIGLGEMLEQFQEEVSTMHNQRLDNKTLANSTMFKARSGIGIREDEPVWPGRWFIVDEMEDVQTMSMGQRFDSTVPDEQLGLTYASRRTGVNDYITGEFSPAMGYSTVGVGAQQLRESAKRFDQTIREVRVALSETGTRVLELYQQFDQKGKEYLAMGEKDGELLHQVLQFPTELIRMGVGVEVTATSASFNKEVEIRTNTIIMQMLMQFYQQAMMAMSYYLNEQLPMPIRLMALQMVYGGTAMLRRILDTHGIQDFDRLVPELQEILNGSTQQLGAIGQAAAGGPPGAPGVDAAAGMGGLPPGVAGALPPAAPEAGAFGQF